MRTKIATATASASKAAMLINANIGVGDAPAPSAAPTMAESSAPVPICAAPERPAAAPAISGCTLIAPDMALGNKRPLARPISIIGAKRADALPGPTRKRSPGKEAATKPIAEPARIMRATPKRSVKRAEMKFPITSQSEDRKTVHSSGEMEASAPTQKGAPGKAEENACREAVSPCERQDRSFSPAVQNRKTCCRS